MADDVADNEGLEGEEQPPARRLSGKRIILFIALPLLLLIGGGAGVYFSGLLDSEPPPAEEGKADGGAPPPPPPAAQAIFFDLPDLIVNLNNTGRKAAFLKISVSLEIENPRDIDTINQVLPRIIDNFQVYLRELRLEDLQGSAGMYRLREELLRRVNLASRPARVRDVLFREMLVQ